MSGFFQRLAARIIQPAQGMHPAVGSLWSTPRAADTLETTTETLAPRQEDNTHIPHAALQPAQQPHSIFRDTEPTHPLRQQEPSESFSTPEKPLIAVPPIQPLAQQAAHAPAHFLSATSSPRQEPGNDPAQQPPLAPHAVPATNALQPRLLQQRPLMPSLPQPARTQPNAPTPSDEIEIHIGRIEVTAVPPPPPARPAPPARKTLDLGEYLKRSRRTR